MTLPYFSSGVCPQLGNLYDDEISVEMRLNALLTSVYRTGRGVTAIMDSVREEATALSTFLGEELPSLHNSELAGLGVGKTDGSTRGLIR